MLTKEEAKEDVKLWCRWALECGCEPFYEHCNQCDKRIKIMREWEQEKLDKEQLQRLYDRGYKLI